MPARGSIATILIALAAGLLVGFAASTLAYRFRLLRVPGENVAERLSHELGLTPGQREQVKEVMHETRFKLMELRHQFQRQRHQLFVQSWGRIRGILNSDQQQKFDRLFPRPSAALGGEHEGEELAPGPPPTAQPQPPPQH